MKFSANLGCFREMRHTECFLNPVILNLPYAPKLLLSESTENSALLNMMTDAQLSPYLNFQQHLPHCTTLPSSVSSRYLRRLTWSPSLLAGHCFSLSLTALVFIFMNTLVLKYIMVQSLKRLSFLSTFVLLGIFSGPTALNDIIKLIKLINLKFKPPACPSPLKSC